MDPFDVLVLQVVARGGLMLDDQIAERVVTADAKPIFGGRRNLRAAIERLQLRGYLAVRPVVYAAATARPGDVGDVVLRVGRKVFDKAYSVTERANAELGMALPPSVRGPFVEHHLKTLDAAQQLERDLRARGGEVLEFKLESELMRERSRGRVFDASGITLGHFPDALLTIRHADGRSESVNIEFVSSKYTDEMISEKARGFSGRTIWAATNAETAARVERLTGEVPLLV